MLYNVFIGRVLCWAFCKYRSPLSELCEDPLEVPGGERHYSDSPGGSELPLQELRGWGGPGGPVEQAQAKLCLLWGLRTELERSHQHMLRAGLPAHWELCSLQSIRPCNSAL